MSRDYAEGKDNPFAEEEIPSLAAVDEALYGSIDIPESGRVVAKPLAITQVWPDMRQPRRAIPRVARGQWNGYPQDVPAVLAGWHELAENEAGEAIDLVALLRSSGEGVEVDPDTSPVVAEYLELVALAASIRNRGLTNAITVTKKGQRFVIETGERRWLAFHMLTLWTDGDYGKIPAVVKDKADVWRQAEENAARRPLNAIGIARQLALLVMDMYGGENFGEFDQVVLPGECDRRYYAQVANGQSWPIQRGMGQAVLNATGLKSKNQISQYRNLLSIPDEMWVQSDEGNWAEFKIRGVLQAANRPFESSDRLTTVNPHAPKTGENGPNRGEMTDFGHLEFNPFQSVGGANLGNQPPTLPMAAGGTTPTDAPLVNQRLRVPMQGDGRDYPPTLPALRDGYEEAGASSTDGTVAEARQVVVVDHPYAALFLQMIGHLNEATERDTQVGAAVASLLQLSPVSVRQIVAAYGGRDMYQAEIDRYTQQLGNFLDRRMDELIEMLERLRAMGGEDHGA